MEEQIKSTLEQIKSNEEVVLNTMHFFNEMTESIAILENIIYSSSEQHNRKIYEALRKLTENSIEMHSLFEQYRSKDNSFQKNRSELLEQRLKRIEQIKQNFNNQGIDAQEQSEDFNFERPTLSRNNTCDIDDLKRKITCLSLQAEKNDKQYEYEINKYNDKLQEMEVTIHNLQIDLEQAAKEAALVPHLQEMCIRLRDQKYRDQILINNMSRKIRNYEKQLNGSNIYLGQSYLSNLTRAHSYDHLSMLGNSIYQPKYI